MTTLFQMCATLEYVILINANLIVATTQGREAIIRILLKRGADVNAKDALGSTALMHAAKRVTLALSVNF